MLLQRVTNMENIIRNQNVIVKNHEQPEFSMLGNKDPAKNIVSNKLKQSFTATSLLNSRLNEGKLIVNGFHPQLTTVPKNYCSYKEQFKKFPLVTCKKRTLDQEISNIVDECRKNEEGEMHKRQRISPSYSTIPRYNCQQEDQRKPRNDLIVSEANAFDLFNDSFTNSHVPQFLATISGRGARCNNTFLKICGASLNEPSESFALFNLVVPCMRSKLFDLFSRAVSHQISIKPPELKTHDDNLREFLTTEKNRDDCGESSVIPGKYTKLENEEERHMTMTLPCIALPASRISQNVTIILMDDKDVNNRCFLCILSPIPIESQGLAPRSEITMGKIQFLSRNQLLYLL